MNQDIISLSSARQPGNNVFSFVVIYMWERAYIITKLAIQFDQPHNGGNLTQLSGGKRFFWRFKENYCLRKSKKAPSEVIKL